MVHRLQTHSVCILLPPSSNLWVTNAWSSPYPRRVFGTVYLLKTVTRNDRCGGRLPLDVDTSQCFNLHLSLDGRGTLRYSRGSYTFRQFSLPWEIVHDDFNSTRVGDVSEG